MTNWQRLARKLDILRSADENLELFGAKSHRYATRKISAEQADELARKGWPQDYISLLLNIGSGAGPYYGIHSLEYSLEDAEERWLLEGRQEFEAATDDEINLLMQEAGARKNLCIPVCEYGCGERFLLAVEGTDQGSLWYDYGFGDQSLEPVNETVLGFYEEWLDTSLKRLGKSI